MKITEQVKRTIAIHFDLDASSISDKASLVDDLGADSLGIMELVLALEEQFGVEIDDDEKDNLVTVGDAIAYIRERSTH